MLQEFKEFISRGNVIDLAVGIIIGAAFTSVVNSLVNDVLMPPIGVIVGQVDFSNMFLTLTGSGDYPSLAAAKEAGASTLNYGLFINSVVNFLIVSLAVFILVKQINRFRRQKEEAPAAPPRSEVLLAEIRDLLKQR
jgi:large conductance mechanosensitive channel